MKEMIMINHSFNRIGLNTQSVVNNMGRRTNPGKYMSAASPARKPQSNKLVSTDSLL
jgi:hypothetical protein